MTTITDPPFADSRLRLLQAATDAFMEEGYRASVDRIAARAGVAKQTLYNHFPSKDELFAEVVHTVVRSILVILETVDGGDLRAQLIRFCTAYREKVLGPVGLAMFRTVVAEAPRFPELSHNFFATGPAATIRHLAAFIAKAMARGDLRSDDPQLAAEMLTGTLTNYDRLRGLIDGDTELLTDTMKPERVVDCFLRAYAPT